MMIRASAAAGLRLGRPSSARLFQLSAGSGRFARWVGQPARFSCRANGRSYEPAAVATFLQAADYLLIARALANGQAVVACEVPLGAAGNIRIPNACLGLGIRLRASPAP